MVTTQARSMRALALGVAALLMIAACTTTPGTPTPTPTGSGPAPTGTATTQPTATPAVSLTGGTMYMLMSTAVANGGIGFQDMDPQRTYTGEDLAFLGATINRSLNAYVYSDDAAVASGLVADAATDTGTPSADTKTWTFTLRDGLMWQDGSPLKCEDFAFGASRTFARELTGGGPTYALSYLDIPSVDGFAAAEDGSAQATTASAYAGPYTDTLPNMFSDEGLTLPIANDQAAFDAAVGCDGNTITFHLKSPIADFNYTVTLGFGAVPNPVDHPDVDTGEAYNQAPWSNGPYMIDELVPDVGGHLHLVRNPYYDASTDESGRMAYPDEWMILFGIDPGVMDQRLMNPSGDDSFAVSYGAVQPENLGTVFADPHTANAAFEGRAFSDFDPYSRYYWIDTSKITNVKIRQAMAVALNRDAIRTNGGGEFVGDYGDGTIKPNIGMDYAPTHIWDAEGIFGQEIPATGDTALAQQLIADSGEAAPSLDWNYVPGAVADRTAAIVKESLEAAGFTVNLVPVPSSYYGCVFDVECQGSFGGAGWGPDWPNASTVISPLFTTDGGWNISRVGEINGVPDTASPDQDFIDAVHANLGQTDRTLQAAEWQRLNTQSVERMYVIPTFFGLAQNIAGDKVGNLYRWGPYGSWPYGILYVMQ